MDRQAIIEKILAARRIADSTKNPQERDTALKIADKLQRQYNLTNQEVLLEQASYEAEQKPPPPAVEITIVLEDESAKEAWRPLVTHVIAAARGLETRFLIHPTPRIFVMGNPELRLEVAQDARKAMADLWEGSIPRSAVIYTRLSWLEGAAGAFQQEMVRLASYYAAQDGLLMKRSTQEAPPPLSREAPNPSGNMQAPPRMGYGTPGRYGRAAPPPPPPKPPPKPKTPFDDLVRPDKHVPRDPASYAEGWDFGIQYANRYYRRKLDDAARQHEEEQQRRVQQAVHAKVSPEPPLAPSSRTGDPSVYGEHDPDEVPEC